MGMFFLSQEDPAMGQPSKQLHRNIELSSSRYGADFMGLSADYVESFFCTKVAALAFMPFIEKLDLNKEFISLQGCPRTADVYGSGMSLTYVPRQISTAENDAAYAAAKEQAEADAAVGAEEGAAPPQCHFQMPTEAISFSALSAKDGIEATMTQIFHSIMAPVPLIVEESSVSPEDGEDMDSEEERELARARQEAERNKRLQEKIDHRFFDSLPKVMDLPQTFVNLTDGKAESRRLWLFIWWIVACEAGIKELRVNPQSCGFGKTEQTLNLIAMLRKKGFTTGQLLMFILRFKESVALQKARDGGFEELVRTTIEYGN